MACLTAFSATRSVQAVPVAVPVVVVIRCHGRSRKFKPSPLTLTVNSKRSPLPQLTEFFLTPSTLAETTTSLKLRRSMTSDCHVRGEPNQ